MEFNATLIGEIIAFALLIWFCVHFIWPYLNKAINDRQQKIADGLAEAERARAELKEADSKVADEIKQARQRASEIIEQAQQQGSQIVDDARSEAVTEADRQKAAAREEISQMTEQAREMLREQVGTLAIQGAEKIVQREIDPGTHKALLDELAAEI